MYYLKHKQQCFIRYKDTRRSRVSLGLIKHALRMFQIASKTSRSSKFIGEVIFKKYVACASRENQSQSLCKSREISITYKDTTRL
jgi:outer membrane protein assembly factor BamD (BamD/ComL family)